MKINEESMTITGVLVQYPKGCLEMALDALQWPLMIFVGPCGSKMVIDKREDFPKTDIPCSCGNPNHWFVQHHLLPDIANA